jgi:phage gpG-like protein
MSAALKVEGDGAKVIAEWQKIFEDGDKAMTVVSRAMAEEMLGLTLERFRVETDPYGKRWKPKQRSDGRKTLSGKTSRLKNGWHIVRCDGSGWTIAPSVAYAAYHQAGTKRMVRRMMVPDAARGLPRAYKKTLQEAAVDALKVSFTPTKKRTSAGGSSLIPQSLSRRFSIRAIARRMVSAVGQAGSGGG